VPGAELDVATWVVELTGRGLSASRVRPARQVLVAVLDLAVADKLIGSNPARGVKAPKLVHHEAAYLDPATVDRIADAGAEPQTRRAAPQPQYRVLVHVLGRCGLRWAEAAGRRRRDVDMFRRITVARTLGELNGRLVEGPPKSGRTRKVPLGPALVAELTEHLATIPADPDAHVFTSPTGGAPRHRAFYGDVNVDPETGDVTARGVWRPAIPRLGLPAVGLHVLRHSAAAALIQADASPKEVQIVMGHASAALTLDRYGHLFDDDLDDLAARADALRESAPRVVRFA
jgi:integrase